MTEQFKIIEEYAQVIREQYTDSSLPVSNIDEVVKAMGGEIRCNANLRTFDNEFVTVTGKDSFIIEVPFNTSHESRNFVVAHAVGHLFMHMKYKTSEWCYPSEDSSQTFNSHEELQASLFAAAFLMPKDVFVNEIEKNSSGLAVDMDKVAKHFCVRPSVAIQRARDLRCIQ